MWRLAVCWQFTDIPSFIFLVRFFRCLSQMEFKRWPLVGVRLEIILR